MAIIDNKMNSAIPNNNSINVSSFDWRNLYLLILIFILMYREFTLIESIRNKLMFTTHLISRTSITMINFDKPFHYKQILFHSY